MERIEYIDELFTNLESQNETIRYAAFNKLISITNNKVSWIYDKWFILLEKLKSDNSYHRSIGLMLIANLSKSDFENKMSTIIDPYLEFCEDEKFITARQCIQNIWKVAFPHDYNKRKIIKYLENAYYENIHLNRHSNLIKQDIISSLYKIYQIDHDENLIKKIEALIDTEIDKILLKNLRKITNT